MQHMFPGHCKGVNKMQYGTCRGSNILCLYRRTLAFKHKLQDWSPQQQQQQRWKHPNAWADFCRKLKHFKQIHTVPCFCRTLTRLVNVHAFALCRPKISLNGCSVSALILCLSTAHMVLNNHNMQLYTTVIPCEARQGLPAAFCLVYAPGVPFDIRYTLFSLCCHAST